MKTRLGMLTILSAFALVVFGQPALAHNLWLNPADHYPPVGSTVDIGIGWGHTYPAGRVDQEIKEGLVEAISAVDPDGLTVELSKTSNVLYRLKVEKAGVYLITARIKPVVFTMTTEGRKRGDKKSVANAVKCTSYRIEAKTVILAGGDARNLDFAAGQPLELIPLTNPLAIKNGGRFAVQALFEGRPLADADVRATFAGFEAEAGSTHASAHKEGKRVHKHFPAESLTDAQGRAELSLDRPGYWMIVISHKPPYPDTAVCDEYRYNTAFTFQLQ